MEIRIHGCKKSLTKTAPQSRIKAYNSYVKSEKEFFYDKDT